MSPNIYSCAGQDTYIGDDGSTAVVTNEQYSAEVTDTGDAAPDFGGGDEAAPDFGATEEVDFSASFDCGADASGFLDF